MAVMHGQPWGCRNPLFGGSFYDYDHGSGMSSGGFTPRRYVGLLGSTASGSPLFRHQSSAGGGTIGGCNADQEKPIGYGAFGVVWAVSDPNYDRRIALKKLPHVFQTMMSAKRAYREIKMLCSLKHDNVLSAIDVVVPPDSSIYGDIYVATELMQSDLHRIIVSAQPLTTDHIKVFVYQILRGLKYLHSAHILHRDIKPGNILVNANCCLKICDFGLARVEELDENVALTHEVVTQYYRAPEILMGARHYTTAVDVWSVGCILAELLSRRILFQAKSPVQQLELILNVVGTPTVQDMRNVCLSARQYVQRKQYRPPNTSILYGLSKDSGHEVVHLLCELLVFNPAKRLSAANALLHPFLEDGRLRYHSCMCSCDHRLKKPSSNLISNNCGGGLGGVWGGEWSPGGSSVCEDDLDPVCPDPFSSNFEEQLTSIARVREKIFNLCGEMEMNNERSLYINTNSVLYNKLTNSQCAQPSETQSSSRVWE